MINPTLAPPPLPLHDPVVNPDRTLSRPWTGYLVAVLQRLGASALSFTGNSFSDQEASIGTTGIEGQDLEGGTYRLSTYLTLTRAATVSSGLQMSFSWIQGGITRVFTGASLTTNNTDQFESVVKLLRSDPGSPISVSVSYVSVGATAARFAFDARLERVP